ncbi:MAG: peptide ABC transporter substrate-binding protein [Planctomycetes bacterium]|nr:peptide ABC transporter substrate-binding protein [Planctomycetota bacterium]MBI3834916.1 peptide ABC transporter substrate-binding protein [Planctomycetota bacterium]
MMRSIVLICFGLLLPILVAYRFAEREPRADFTYVNPSGVHTLDPARMSWTQDFRIALNVWEGLTSWDPKTLAPIAGAAYFPPEISSDRLTYTFRIREDARWSNGDPVTAADFIRGWRRAMEPGTAADYAFLFTDHIAGAEDYVRWRQETFDLLKSLDTVAQAVEHDAAFDQAAKDAEEHFSNVAVESPDDRTLILRLTRPCPYFIDLTGFPTLLPIHKSIELLRAQYRGAPYNRLGLVTYDPQWTKPDYHANGYSGLVTNGSYRIADWQFKRRVRMTTNPHYRDAARLACRTIDMLEFDNLSASIMAYESGDVDFLTDLSVPYEHELFRRSTNGERPDFKSCKVLATYFFNFNCVDEEVNGRVNPFRDARVRRAFSLTADREHIVNNVLRRGDRVARSFVPHDAISGYGPPEGLQRNVEESRRLLAEAGYPNGEGLPLINILYSPSDEKVCQAMARTWEDTLNVRIDLRALESKTFAAEKREHRFMIARGNWYADYNDPTTFLDTLISQNGNNDSGYSNSEYDDRLRRANDASADEERFRILQDAERMVVERDCPILPILHRVEMIAVKPYVHGIIPNARLWFPFREIRVDR